MGDITTDHIDIKKIMREYCEQLYAELSNLDKTDKLLERQTTPLVQEETDNLHCPISIKDIDYIVKALPTKKIAAPDGLASKSDKKFKE